MYPQTTRSSRYGTSTFSRFSRKFFDILEDERWLGAVMIVTSGYAFAIVVA